MTVAARAGRSYLRRRSGSSRIGHFLNRVAVRAAAEEPALQIMPPKVRLFDRHIKLPESKPMRVGLGTILIGGGLLGFLPVLGFWMIPLGLLVLSVDLPAVRRWRRQFTVWWNRCNEDKQNVDGTDT